MYLRLVADDGSKIDLFNNDYFTITDFDGMTEGNTSISSSILADTDGDTINAQMVNARDVTLTLRFKDTVSPELSKRFLLKYFKLKKEIVLELNYKDRISRLTGYVQAINIPRFTNSVTAQVDIHCSNPFWQDVDALVQMISDVQAMHHWPIHPTEEEPIYMGLLIGSYQSTIVNNGDVDIGMIITIVAEKAISKPRIMIDRTSDFLEVNVAMEAGQELIINTNKGQKSVTLDGVNVINKLVSGSTWLQLGIGETTIICSNNLSGEGMLVNVTANERYL